MKIQLNRNMIVEGAHKAIDEIVEVAEEIGRYLLGNGAARTPGEGNPNPAPKAEKAAPKAKADK